MIIRDRQDIKMPSEGEWDISRWDMNSRDLSSFYGTSGGTVKITRSSNAEVNGSFSYSAFGATVEESFTAKETNKANTVICAPDCDSS